MPNGSSSGPDVNGQAGPDFSQLTDDMYKQWEQAMTSWWDQVLDSKDVLGATGKNLSAMAGARKRYEEGVDEGLNRLHLPTRTDLVRVTRIATLLEERLLQLEDTLLLVNDKLDLLERETVQARVEAAENRLELRERLGELQARLDAVDTPVGSVRPAPAKAAAKTPRKPRARKASGAKGPGRKSATTDSAE